MIMDVASKPVLRALPQGSNPAQAACILVLVTGWRRCRISHPRTASLAVGPGEPGNILFQEARKRGELAAAFGLGAD